MIVRRVTQVSLTRTTDAVDDVQWRVDWTEIRKNKVERSSKAHGTETAARRHVRSLLDVRAAGLSMDAIFTDGT